MWGVRARRQVPIRSSFCREFDRSKATDVRFAQSKAFDSKRQGSRGPSLAQQGYIRESLRGEMGGWAQFRNAQTRGLILARRSPNMLLHRTAVDTESRKLQVAGTPVVGTPVAVPPISSHAVVLRSAPGERTRYDATRERTH